MKALTNKKIPLSYIQFKLSESQGKQLQGLTAWSRQEEREYQGVQ